MKYRSFANKINELKSKATLNPGIFSKSTKVEWLVAEEVESISFLIGYTFGMKWMRMQLTSPIRLSPKKVLGKLNESAMIPLSKGPRRVPAATPRLNQETY